MDFIVDESGSGALLRNYIRRGCGVSLSLFRTLKRVERGITVNGAPATALTVLACGDVITLNLPPDKLPLAAASGAKADILYEDGDIIAFDKPAGMPTHTSPGHFNDSLANVFSRLCLERGETLSFRPLYRLDRNTSGIVLAAKNRYAAHAVFPTVRKLYTAVAAGTLSGSGVIEAPIGFAEGSKIKRAVSPDGQYARTEWRALKACGGYTLCEVTLVTGRTHQIRVHFAGEGHPLAGDELYGGDCSAIARQALHCGFVTFDTLSGVRKELISPLPDDMERFISSL